MARDLAAAWRRTIRPACPLRLLSISMRASERGGQPLG